MRFFADNADYFAAKRSREMRDTERDFEFRIDMKTAKKLRAAMSKGPWNKLTQAEADALDDFVTELLMQAEATNAKT